MIPFDLYAERVGLEPIVWAAHFSGDRYLGDLLHIDDGDTIGLVGKLLSPYAFAYEVTESYAIFDGFSGLLENGLVGAERVVYVARLRETACFWVVPTSITDDGFLGFGEPRPSEMFFPGLASILSSLLMRRWPQGLYEEVVEGMTKWM